MLTQAIGKVGSGKSLWAMEQTCLELRATQRQIVTTMDVLEGELNAYVQKRWPTIDCQVCQRVTKINKEQLKQFWRYRGRRSDGSQIVLPEFGTGESWNMMDPVFYLLDEVHEGFGARNWQKTGPEFISYISQHRHLGDDILGTCPQSTLLDKQFRNMVGECVILDNFYKRKVGLFRMPRYIKWAMFANCPPVPGELPTQEGKMTIDPDGLAGTYRTEGGLGVVGKQADKGKVAKGIPWWWLLVGLGALIVLAWFASKIVFRLAGVKSQEFAHLGVAKALNGTPGMSAPVQTVSNVVVNSEALVAALWRDRMEKEAAARAAVVKTNPVARAYAVAGRVAVVTTDTEQLWGEHLDVRGGLLVLDGRLFDFRPLVRGVSK